jgi:hypothetical protein
VARLRPVLDSRELPSFRSHGTFRTEDFGRTCDPFSMVIANLGADFEDVQLL